MQQHTRMLLVLFAIPASVAASSVSASSAATAWLQSHRSPTDDQLGALQSANPEAFAIVSALLKKHPNGVAQLAPEERGPDVFRKMMGTSHLAKHSAALPYATSEIAAVQPPMADVKNYNAKTAADRDESSVSRLLSAVASMGGAKGKKIGLLLNKHRHSQESENALANDASLFSDDSPQTPAPLQAIEQEIEAPVAPPVQAQEQAAAAPHENSYLKGIDLSGDMPEVLRTKKAGHKHTANLLDSVDSLATFSFDDAAPPTPAPKKKVVAPKPKENNAFLKFLGFVKEAPAPEEKQAAPAKPAGKKPNSYLANINFFGS